MAFDIDWGVELDRVVLYPLFTSGTNKGGMQAVDENAFEGYEVPGPVSLDFSFGNPRTIPNVSRGRVNDTIILPSIDPKTAVLVGSYNSQTINALLTGAIVNTMGLASVMPETTSEEGNEIQCAMLVQQLVSHNDDGDLICVSEFFTKVTLVPQKANYGANATAKNYQIAFAQPAKYAWGESLTLATHGATKAASAHIQTNGRFNAVGWMGGCLEADFMLPTDKPALTSSTAKVWNYVTGVAEAGTWDAATDAAIFTPTVVPSTGELLVCTYEY